MRQLSGYPEYTKWFLAILFANLVGLSACSSSSDNPTDANPDTIPTLPGDDGPGTPDALVAPEIERIVVYSGTAAEIFWQRPPQGSPVARVEVSRDSVVLGTTDGNSFFDDSRSPGVDYVYTLVAIAADGQRSDGGVSDPGSDGDGLDIIRADNAVTLIAAVFDAYRGEPWWDIVYALPGFSRTPNRPPNEELTSTCDNGGTASIRRIYTGEGNPGFGYVFDNCQDGETLFDGQIDNYGDRYGTRHVRGDGITITAQTGTIRYSGHMFELPGSLQLYIYADTPVDFEKSDADSSLLLVGRGGYLLSVRLLTVFIFRNRQTIR